MKRVFSLVLLSAFVLSIFSACSSAPATSLMSFIDESDDSLDFGGIAVTVCSESEVDTMIFEQLSNTTMYDAIIARLNEIEKKYNCEIEHVYYGAGIKMVNNIIPKLSTGDKEIDIIYGHGDNAIGELAVGGCLYPLSDLQEYLNYENSEKFGSAGILESAMIDGIPYAVQPVQWLGFSNSFAYTLVWNVDKFAQFGLPNLHEFYENKTWTWENFEGLFETYSKVAEPEKYLISLYRPFFSLSAMMSNGVKFCDFNGTDFYCDLNDQKTLTAAEWSLNFYKEYADIISSEDGDYSIAGFAAERDYMVPAQSGVTALALPYKVDFKFSIMPFPSGPDGNYGEWANFVHAIRGFGISATSDIVDVSAVVISDLFEPFSEISTENGLVDYYNEYVFFTPMDTEIYLDIGKYARSIYAAGDGTIWSFAHAFSSENQTAAQIIQSYSSRMENFVVKELRPNYENYVYDHLYGDKAN